MKFTKGCTARSAGGGKKLARPHVLPEDLEIAYLDMAADEVREQEVTSLTAPVAMQVQRLGFMAGRIVVPDDFDRMGKGSLPTPGPDHA